MKIRDIVALAVVAYLLCGCDEVRTRLHMMPNQDEQECLNSERLNFKDPDVLFVANLGDRGWKLEPKTYWVRYKAKNSYGAYLQGNMLCKQSGGKWVRDTSNELIISLSVIASLLEDDIAQMKSGNRPKSRISGRSTEKNSDEAYMDAKVIVNERPDSLASYYAKDKQANVGKN